jgi:hypothetical protein
MDLSRARHDYARRQSCTTAIASFARAVEPGTGHQPEDRRKVAQAGNNRGYEDESEAAAFDGLIPNWCERLMVPCFSLM